VRVSRAGAVPAEGPAGVVRDAGDLLGAIVSLLGVGVVVVLAVYAHGTTTGVAQDVVGFAGVLRRVLVVPVTAMEGAVTLVVPVAILADLALRGRTRVILQALAGGAGSAVLWFVLVLGVRSTGSERLTRGLSILFDGTWSMAVPVWIAVLAGLLTVVGSQGRRRSVAWSWAAVWVVVGAGLVVGHGSLTGSAAALLVGRAAGQLTRYLGGVAAERIDGDRLVEALRHVGVVPSRLIHTRDTLESRDFAVWTAEGRRLSVIVLDGDRQAAAELPRLWRAIRLKGLEARPTRAAGDTAERSALVALLARAAGARTPEVLAVATVDESALIVEEYVEGLTPLLDLAPDFLTDDVLADSWRQVRTAHSTGVTHRAITSEVIQVESTQAGPAVWLTDWHAGSLASSDLTRRVDLVQVLTVLALRVGPTRAVASAVAALPPADVMSMSALVQTLALPSHTRTELRAHREVLVELRAALAEIGPDLEVQPERLTRIGGMQALTMVGSAVALVAVLTTLNIQEVTTALDTSDWRWSLVALALGGVTFLGAALTYVALAPVRLGIWSVVRVQVAAAFVVVAAPAGLGPAALNVRMLTRRGIAGPLAVATVALVQFSQFVVTVVVLVVFSLIPGGNHTSVLATAPAALGVAGVVAAIVGGLLLFRPLRTWAWDKATPVVKQTWPRLVEVLGQPRRLAMAVIGDLVITLGWVLAFAAALAAFGQHLSLVQVAVVYFVGNAAGAILPTPGGMGTIEVALTAGLTTAGLNPGVAASVAILFRILTFWVQIPVGWVAMRGLVRRGLL